MSSWPFALPATRNLGAEAEGWAKHATALATFYRARLVNRCDVWGGYRPLPMRAERGAVWTAPPVRYRGARILTAETLARHFRGASVSDVIGLHVIAADDTCRWGAFDIDAHEQLTDAERAARLELAQLLGERVAEFGVSVLLEDSDGRHGFHVWFYFDAPVPSAALFVWLRALAAWATACSGIEVEHYPKQPQLDSATQFGNWLRIPGRHHTQPHFSRLSLPGESWRAGEDAARLLLRSWRATPAGVVPPYVAPIAELAHTLPASHLPPQDTDLPRDRAAVILAYLRKLPNSEPGARSDRLFTLARFLRQGMQCTEAEAMPILQHWNASNVPPLPAAKLSTTWENAGKYSSRHFALKAGARVA